MNVLIWIFKKFWFPILIAVLGLFAGKSPAIDKLLAFLRKFK